MKKSLLAVALLSAVIAITDADARGGISSGGGRGGFSSSRSFSSGGSRSFSSPRSTTTVTRSTTISRNSYFGGRYYGGYHYGYGYGWHPYMFGGPWGMGYMWSDGLMEGIIIGSLMHPAGTTVYNGGGYGQPALLYPDGAVVSQQGQQVGTYANNVFTPMANGPMLAQQAPTQGNPQMQQQAQPVVIQQAAWDAGEVIAACVIGAVFFIIILAIIF